MQTPEKPFQKWKFLSLTNKQTNKQINNQNKLKYQNNKNRIIHLLDAKYAPFAMYTLMFRKIGSFH